MQHRNRAQHDSRVSLELNRQLEHPRNSKGDWVSLSHTPPSPKHIQPFLERPSCIYMPTTPVFCVQFQRVLPMQSPVSATRLLFALCPATESVFSTGCRRFSKSMQPSICIRRTQPHVLARALRGVRSKHPCQGFLSIGDESPPRRTRSVETGVGDELRKPKCRGADSLAG
jgi:hypothetical protein